MDFSPTERWVEGAAKSLRDVQVTGDLDMSELPLGVLRFGRASARTSRPLREFDEGSDASSVQTIDHEVIEDDIAERMVEMPSVVVDTTSLYRRLWYFFLHYDKAKLRFIDEIIAQHVGMEATLLAELEAKYGPEPNKMRWETRDQIAHQREINLQLKAQLARARDELLLLGHEITALDTSMERVEQRKDILLRNLETFGTPYPPKESLRIQEGAILTLLRVVQTGETLGTRASDLDKEFFFPAPRFFFDFVADQVKVVRGATAHPRCVLCEVPIEYQPGSGDGSGLVSELNTSATGALNRTLRTNTAFNSTNTLRSVQINRHLLGVWAQQFGDHSVAVKSGNRWQFYPAEHYWKSMQ